MRYIILLTIVCLLCGLTVTGCDNDHRRHHNEWSGPTVH